MVTLRRWNSLSLTSKVLISMLLGALIGLLSRTLFPDHPFVTTYFTDGIFLVVGKIFITCLKMLVVPLIFTSLVCGTCSLRDATSLGRLGIKTIGIYMMTTCIAITLAIIGALIVKPGVGANLTATSTFAASEAPSLADVIIGMFPSNPIGAMASGNTLQIIVFALLFGISIAASGKKGQKVADLFISMNEVMMKLVALLMNIAPYGVFALMARLFSQIEFGAILNLLQYFVLLVAILIMHLLLTYCSMLRSWVA